MDITIKHKQKFQGIFKN